MSDCVTSGKESGAIANAILQASQQSIHAERMEAVVGGPSERMDIDAAAAASVPIPPPPNAFVGAWNDPLFLGYLRNHPNNVESLLLVEFVLAFPLNVF